MEMARFDSREGDEMWQKFGATNFETHRIMEFSVLFVP
jgi:hypothetical protein